MSTCGVELQSEHELRLLRVCSVHLTLSSYGSWFISVISEKGKRGNESECVVSGAYYNQDQCFIFPRWEIISKSHFNHKLNHAPREIQWKKINVFIYSSLNKTPPPLPSNSTGGGHRFVPMGETGGKLRSSFPVTPFKLLYLLGY